MPIYRYGLLAISVLVSLFAAAVGGIRLAGLMAEGGTFMSVIVWAAVWILSTAVLVVEFIRSERGHDSGNVLSPLAEAMPVGFALYDPQDNLVGSNELFRRTLPDAALPNDDRDEMDLGPQGRVRFLRRSLPDGGCLIVTVDINRELELKNEVREATTRINQLLGMVADWTWETDVLHRFSAVAKIAEDRTCPELKGMVGYNPVELALDNVGSNDWSAEQCLREMDRHVPLQDRGLRLVLDGSVCAVRLSAVPRYDDFGEFLGYCGIGKRVIEASEPKTKPQVRQNSTTSDSAGRLLLVDDSTTNRLLAESILKRMGYEVTTVESGRNAIDEVRTGDYAAVLMDIWMPEMDGFEATAAIRALPPPHGEIPVIAMTAHVGEEERLKCLQAGMNEHVAKPIDRAHLASVLEQFVGPAGSALSANEADAPPAPDQADLVNDDVLRQLRNDAGPALVDELIGAYMAETDDRLVRIDSALEAGSLDEIGADAHSMKSSSGTFGALQLQEHAARLEAAAMAKDFDAVAEANRELRTLVSSTWAAFAERGFRRD